MRPPAIEPTFAERFPLFMRAAVPLTWAVSLVAPARLLVLGTDALGKDAHAYWLTGQGGSLYGLQPGATDAFLYSPAFAQLVRPLTMLPWPGFLTVWIGVATLALCWLLRPMPARWAVPLFLLCLPELYVGNIHLLLAVVAVAGFTRPWLWAFPMLTKITPGVGLLWFAARAEWRPIMLALGATGLIVAVSCALHPSAWLGWGWLLVSNHDGAPDGPEGLVIRSLLAIAIVLYGARRGQHWVVAVAMLLAAPVAWQGALPNLPPMSLLAALPRLVLSDGARGRSTERSVLGLRSTARQQ